MPSSNSVRTFSRCSISLRQKGAEKIYHDNSFIAVFLNTGVAAELLSGESRLKTGFSQLDEHLKILRPVL